MGILRLALALCVVAGHTRGWYGAPLLSGVDAVKLFYVISGFYMAIVLEGKYRAPGGVGLFYSNRLARLFPAYWIILLLAVVCLPLFGRSTHLGLDEWRHLWHEAHPLARLYLITLNLGILLQDTTLFTYFSFDDGLIHGTMHFSLHEYPAYRALFVPQAWSIGVELLFYAVAPWLLPCRARVLLAVMAASYGLRWAAYAWGLAYDPFTYRFFPFELGTFLAGALAARLRHEMTASGHWRTLLVAGWTAVCCFSGLMQGAGVCSDLLRDVVLVGLLAVSLPTMFHAGGAGKRLDRFAGSLSYPLYLNHNLVALVVVGLWGAEGLGGWKSLLVAALAVLLAAGIVLLVEHPVDRWRQARVRTGV